MKRVILLLCFVAGVVNATLAQSFMSPPTVMIVPDDIYCKSRGYIITFDNMGAKEEYPDYERALREDKMLHPVLIQIAELINSRNSQIEIVDLLTAINNSKNDRIMDQYNDSDESEAVDEAIIRASQADIIIKFNYDIVQSGPNKQVQYTITGTDSYTSIRFAPVTGVGSPSTAANSAILVREAIFGKMDSFLNRLLAYYANMVTNGRAVAFNFKIGKSSNIDMDSKVGGYSLKEIIDDLLYDNSANGRGLEKLRGGRTFLIYQSVYIPLFATIRGRERKQSATMVAQKICSELESKYQITCNYKTYGLGKVNIYIGQ